ncbi:diguanylate cyclase domain-containing protein [Parazoarcus communis]|nr:diguanylate cyclase [Parazoarcus communis]
MPASEAFSRRHLALAFAILMPFLALALQLRLWTSIEPLAFVLFYPALVVSSWIGGRSGGTIALILSIVLADWFFMAPLQSLRVDDPAHIARIVAFSLIGILIIYAHHRFQLRTERYQNTTENIDDVVWVLDAETQRLRYVSPSIVKQLGFAPAEIMALPIESALTPTIAAQVRCLAAGDTALGNTVTEEVRKTRKDGSTVWTEVVMTQARNQRTGKQEVHGVSRNITARKYAEEQLKVSEQRMRKMLDNIPTAIACCTLGSKAEIVFLNRQFVRIFGYSLDEIPDLGTWEQLSYPDEQSRRNLTLPWEMAVGTIPRESAEGMESRILCKNGSMRDVLINADRLEDMMLVSFTDITERKQAEQRLRHMAQHDALTDLPNRVLFDEHVSVALATARREGSRFGLMFIDLDHFKKVNDTMGHRIGDLLLLEVSQRLRQAVRESDIPARLGGDEFVVLLQHVHHAGDALRVAEKIRTRLGEPFSIENNTFSISASLGIAIYPDHGKDSISLARNADTAMYHAKQSGRNAITLSESGAAA